MAKILVAGFDTETSLAYLKHIALKTAYLAHLRQVDKNGEPFIFHPLAVAMSVRGDKEKIVALLHDVVEDTDITLNNLALHYPLEIIQAIDAITRRESETYKDYIYRLGENSLATKVKIADLKHNMLAFRKTDDSESLNKRYKWALELLTKEN